jgi:N-acetylglucosaminyl-diphospho-decaprenol L-rhamnosyltransferase
VISISIISHQQAALSKLVLSDLSKFAAGCDLEIFLTLNTREPLSISVSDYPWPVHLLENCTPKGFGANHNQAFRRAKGEWFCVLNPDIRLFDNLFPRLVSEAGCSNAAVIAPAAYSVNDEPEDSVRHFPTLRLLLGKLIGRDRSRYDFEGESASCVDWVAGMFMLFRSEDFRLVGGFDEKFFLYYEDVDICARLWNAGRPVLFCPTAKVIHNARRSSRTDPRYMRWHAASMLRYFMKHWGRLPKIPKNLT